MAAAAALALAPALAGFTFLPWLGLRWAALGLILVWLVALSGLVAGTGGWGSPLVAALLIPVILARTLGRWTRIAAIGAVVGYAATGASTLMYAGLGWFTVTLTICSLLLAGWLLGFAQRGAQREQAQGQRSHAPLGSGVHLDLHQVCASACTTGVCTVRRATSSEAQAASSVIVSSVAP